MIKANLARIVYETHGGISYRDAKAIVDVLLEQMKNRLIRGESVKLSGFGSFNVIRRKARLGRNPQTGDRLQLPPSRYVTFRPSRKVF
ncbi:MAG: integration host factor subunit alpha [Acidobacteriota bacterium]